MTMRILFFERLKQRVRASSVNLLCVFVIAILTGGCASEYKKVTTPVTPSPGGVLVSHADETGQAPEKGESVNGETNDDQEIVCRRIAVTGSRIKRKFCATKEQWAFWSKKTGENAERYIRDANEASKSGSNDPMPPQPPPPGLGAMPPLP
jgi:hypothetical protein